MSFYCFIPARKGSKRLKNKNKRLFHGKPLIEWSILCAINSNLGADVIVSSDDEEIRNICEKYSQVYFHCRPKYLADDKAKTIDVVKNAITMLSLKNQPFVILQPTSPLRTSEHLRASIIKFNKSRKIDGIKSIVSVSNLKNHEDTKVYVEKNTDLIAEDRIKKNKNQLYYLNGAIYISMVEDLKRSNTTLISPAQAFFMEEQNSLDIDNQDDFDECLKLFQKDKYYV